MDYNDIIIILLLVIIIGLVLTKKDYAFISGFGLNQSNQSNETPMFLQPNVKSSKHFQNYRNNDFSINDELNIMKRNKNKNRNKNSIVMTNRKYSDLGQQPETLDSGSNSEISFENNSENNFKNNSRNNSKNNLKNNMQNSKPKLKSSMKNPKSQFKNNNFPNKKVIIDDYSEFDNIKSLNSMDNTLSDLISVVENDK
jgi:hypothetical protein